MTTPTPTTREEPEQIVRDLTMIVLRLCRRRPQDDVQFALDYLQRKNLSSPLRTPTTRAEDDLVTAEQATDYIIFRRADGFDMTSVCATVIALHEALAAVMAERDRQYDENVHRIHMQALAEARADAAEARVVVLEKALVSARETILQLFNARWSEAEGSAADWTAEIDAALQPNDIKNKED